MNKTVTINISGIIFHIEEDAFDKLNIYLNKIKSYFNDTEGGSEIMADIEARIAELLQTKISTSKQVVLPTDVDEVIAVMGKPEEFSGESEKGAQQQTANDYQFEREKIKRRLYRNPDDKAIGGVCSGLAAYFDVDTVWVRLGMFLLFFFGGLSLWVYIVLWIVMPEARTTAEKFAMRGETANINNIYKSFKEEAEDVKSRFKKYGKEFKDQNYGAAVRSNAAIVVGTIFGLIARLIGLIMVIVGGVFLFFYTVSLMGISFAEGNGNWTNWRHILFTSSSDYGLSVFSFVVVLGIPLLLLIYTGVKLLFRIRYSNRWLNLSLGILWTVGIVAGIFATANTTKHFSESATLKESIQLRDIGDTIVVTLNNPRRMLDKMDFDNNDDLETYLNRRRRERNDYFLGEKSKSIKIISFARLSVSESLSDSVELTISRIARGLDKQDANERAKVIDYHYLQNGNTLMFDEIFSVKEDEKFRKQKLNIKLKIPRGKVVYFDKSVKHFLDDIDNTTNTWEGNMIERRWIMTGRGLKCLDCENLDQRKEEEKWRNEDVEVNEDGIHVSGKDAEIRINQDGINIKTPEKNVVIGKKRRQE
jgi:phage shock protein PspC (stress-responsive transcriptional regulator)